jgi:hypothetical protein
MRWIGLFVIVALATVCVFAQPSPPVQEPSSGAVARSEGFGWGAALEQSFLFLSIEHSLRLTQAKTRSQFQGKFMKNYWTSIKNIRGWGDGDSVLTNCIAHPMQGGVAGFIQIQNDPDGIRRELSMDSGYWRSRLKAMGWAALYSTQFEIGPISEATIGHVGKEEGTAGYSDLVVTPLGGLGMLVLEDAVDRFVISRLEPGGTSLGWQRFLRVTLNPQRSLANLLRFKRPWHRDTRQLSPAQP